MNSPKAKSIIKKYKVQHTADQETRSEKVNKSLDIKKEATTRKKSYGKKSKFDKKPSFVSESCIVTADDLPEDIRPSSKFTDGLDCKMESWFDKKGNALKYEIQVTGMELIYSNTDHRTPDGTLDDVDGAHIHKMTNGDVTNPKGAHQLNTFGNPGFDDSDDLLLMIVKYMSLALFPSIFLSSLWPFE